MLAKLQARGYTCCMRILLFPLLLLAASAAYAGDAPEGTRVNLSAQSEQLLANDEVVAEFRIEASGKMPQKLQSHVNRISQAISARMQRERGVKLTTTGRRMDPVWRYESSSRKRVRDGWHLVQSLRITSSNLDAVPNWLDEVENAGAHMQSLAFRVSHESASKAQETLRMQAIDSFRQRATATARALGATSFQILHLNTDIRMPVPMRRSMAVMAMAEAKSAPAPALEAGESRISVSVSGEILLPRQDYPVK